MLSPVCSPLDRRFELIKKYRSLAIASRSGVNGAAAGEQGSSLLGHEKRGLGGSMTFPGVVVSSARSSIPGDRFSLLYLMEVGQVGMHALEDSQWLGKRLCFTLM